MSDDKKQQGSSGSSSSGSSNESGNSGNNSGNDIPFVPPSDRTRLNENLDYDTKPSFPPSPTTKQTDE